ncbi:MAG: glycosyltransferase family 4 protein [Candidatus Thiodiazotropha sp.]
MLRAIVNRWKENGHEIDVLSSQPSYKTSTRNEKFPKRQMLDGINVIRLNLPHESGRPIVRVFNAIKLAFAVLTNALIKRYDVIMISTAPPVVGGLSAALATKITGARFIYHCMDLHPEVGNISGEFSNPYIYRLLLALDSWSCKRANPVVVLSSDMENTLRRRSGGQKFKIRIINNFSLPSDVTIPDQPSFDLPHNGLNILFAGNIGRFQGLESCIDAMGLIRNRHDIRLILMGDGFAKTNLQKRAKDKGANVIFIGHQPIEIAKSAMRHSDLGLVSLMPGVYRYAYPSKTMSYLEQGCPLVLLIEPESELAQDVVSGEYGFCVPVGDSQSLAKLLTRIADDRSWQKKMRERAYEKAKNEFSEPVVLGKWCDLINLQSDLNG